MRSGSLSRRLLVWILPVSLATTSAISLSTYLIARRVILWETQQSLAAVTHAAAAQITGYFEQRANDLATIAQSPLFRDHYMNVEYGLSQEAAVYRRDIEHTLADLQRRTRAYPRLSYVDASGREICAVSDGRPATPDLSAIDAALLAALRSLRRGQRTVSRIIRAPEQSAPLVRYAMPLIDDAGRFRGALVFATSLGPVYTSLGRLRLGGSGRILLSDRRHPASAPAPPTGDVLISSVDIAGTPWSVVAAVRRGDYLYGLAWVSSTTLLLALFACLALILIITRQVRVLLRPLAALSDAVSAYASGDLDARVKAAGPPEVAALGHSFNAMADRLRARTHELVQRVRELTALHRMNETALRQLGKAAIGRACLESAVQGFGFQRGMLLWVDERRSEIVGGCAYDRDSADFSQEVGTIRIPLDGTDVLARAARGGPAVTVAADPAFAACLGTARFCAAPVKARDRTIAVLCVGGAALGESLSAQQSRSLSLFCSAAGLALENAQLLDAIVESETRYRTAVENSPHAVVSLDQNFRIRLWNRRAEALFGHQPTEAFGRTLETIFGTKTYRSLLTTLEQEGSIRQAEVSGFTRDGRPLDLNVSWTGQSAGPNGAREWFVVLQDETEKKKLQTQLVRSEKLTAVGSLIAGVAHELNNPLAAVLGFAELLKNLPAKPEDKDDLRLLYESALRCRDIVQGLLLFVRQGTSAHQRISLNEAVQSTLALMEYRLVKTEGLALEVELDPALPQVAGELPKIQQVLINLLTNACDALKGRITRVVRVRTRALPDGARLEVEDTGPGITPEKRLAVFEPFYTTKPPGQGTGLGLPISRQIMAALGGDLTCGPGREGGALFAATFPRCPSELPSPQTAAKLPPPAQGRRVLVVDDEPEVLQLMMRLLAEDGLVPSAAMDPQAALRLLAEERFDLVIADVDLGSLKGTRLLEGVAKPPPLLLVTGDVLNPELSAEVALINASVLPKPFLRTEFLRLVRRELRRRGPETRGRGARIW